MNRRGFIGALAAAIAGSTLDPERLLWVPKARTISIPRPIANSGLLGIQYYDVSGCVGSYMGIPRAAYPSAFAQNGQYPKSA